MGHDEFGSYLEFMIRGEGVDVSRLKRDEAHATGLVFKEVLSMLILMCIIIERIRQQVTYLKKILTLNTYARQKSCILQVLQPRYRHPHGKLCLQPLMWQKAGVLISI